MSKLNLFISYSHKEKEQYIPELLNYVNEQNCSKIDIWYDEKISPGNDWDDSIKDKLNKADIVLLLLSQSFLMSKYVKENELTVALQRHKAGECRVIPIFIRKCFLDNYPQIRELQGLPRDMSFISDMGEEKWGHYTEIVQELNDIAHDIETNRNISKTITNNNSDKAKSALEIEQLSSKRKIFLSIPDSEEGLKKRRDLIIQAEGKIKYEGWPYEIVPGIKEAAELVKTPEFEQSLKSLISESIYSIHIINAAKDLAGGTNTNQYEYAQQEAQNSAYFKSIVWLLNADIKASLNKEVSMNPIATGNDYDNIFELIKSLDSEKEKKISQLKRGFSSQKKVYMFYDFTKDHNNDLRIDLKSKIEENENLAVRFSIPNVSLEKEREDLEKCEGGCIFYGATDPQWFVYRQSILLDAGFTQSKAVFIDEPEIDKKIQRDVSKNAFMVIKGKTEFDSGIKSFLDRLKSMV